MTAPQDWRKLIQADFLEHSAAAFAAPYLDAPAETQQQDDAGAIVGRYRLLTEIGRGGMGSVWLAERADGHFEQRVALKLIKRGMDSDEILARFLRERQILARLTHPQIARLLDGGVSEDGRPWFVMEYVQGEPITRYCDAHRLGVDQRVRLFASVCRAVQYAHRSLVVHRDIKPSNVLVSEAGEVKLLDFGVAKLLDPDEAGALDRTAGGLLTPEYASPEQLAGGPVTTASDVYQLGILLFELLAGRRPRRSGGRHTPYDASNPSTAVSRSESVVHRDGRVETIDPAGVSERRCTTPERLRRRLRGDLDAIVLRTLRPEAERRYPSAEALAEDSERHLAHLPIRFGGESFGYRAGKFLRRYRMRVAAAALLLLTAAVLGVLYLAQIRAERDRALRESAKTAETTALVQRFLQGWSPDAADRSKVSAEMLLGDAVRRARLELTREPELLAATLSTLGGLHMSIGNTSAADTLLAQALAIQERLTPGPSLDLAATLARRGKALLELDLPAAQPVLRRALAMYRSLMGPRRPEVLRVQRDLAIALRLGERLSESEALLRDALAQSPDREAPDATEMASDLGYVLFNRARYSEAEALLRTTLAQQRRIFGPLHQSTLITMRNLAASLRGQASLPEAEALDREALLIVRTLYGENHAETDGGANSLAVLLERKGDFAEAERLMRAPVAHAVTTWGENYLYTALRVRTLASVRLAQGDLREAEALLRRALAGLSHAFPAGHPDMGDILNRLAYVVLTRHAPDAEALYAQAVAFDRARPAAGPYFVTDGYEYLGWAARRRGDRELAERLFRRAVELYAGELPVGHPYRASAVVGLGQVLLDAGRRDEAAGYLRDGLAQWQAARPAQPARVAEARGLLQRAGAF